MRVSVYFNANGLDTEALGRHTLFGRRLLLEDIGARFGVDTGVANAFAKYAGAAGLEVRRMDRLRRRVELVGTAQSMTEAFRPDALHLSDNGFPTRAGYLYLPSSLAPHVAAVAGLDNRPIIRVRSRPRSFEASAGGFYPSQLASIYNFPSRLDGSGQRVSIIEFRGGYLQSDLDAYFTMLGTRIPRVMQVCVGVGTNDPTGDPNGPDAEVMLDLEVVGGAAPGADIVIYFTEDNERGFIDAVFAAIFDAVHRPTIVCISWGAAESDWTPQVMIAMSQLFQIAALLGITICVASGDNGAIDQSADGSVQVDFPASSPWVLGCGGTTLKYPPRSETCWNSGNGGASGGGVSSHFPVPAYQNTATIPVGLGTGRKGRGVPDVAASADPSAGYIIRVDGKLLVSGGTSAAAPLWSGLIARINQALPISNTGVGFFTPFLYGQVTNLHDVEIGDNKISGIGYDAGAGWDACTGLGTPNGEALMTAVLAEAACNLT